MKIILLDENIPAPLKKHFSVAFEVFTVHDKGWQSKEDQELLEAISEADFDFLMTADLNLEYQQNLSKYNLRLVVLLTYDNRYQTLKLKVPVIEAAILDSDAAEKIIRVDLRN